MKKFRHFAQIFTLGLTVLIPGVSQANNGQNGGVHALYNGRIIDLSAGWQGAQVCAAYNKSNVRCYDSPAAFDAANGLRASVKARRSPYDCPSGWFCLWEHINFAGRKLQFRSQGYCQNLTDWGFNDKASSY